MLIQFDNRVVSVLAIKKAAYKFIHLFAAQISLEGDKIQCHLHFTPPQDEARSTSIAEDFNKEVLDQDLREHIRTETRQIRDLIFAHAFSKTGIVGNEQIPAP